MKLSYLTEATLKDIERRIHIFPQKHYRKTRKTVNMILGERFVKLSNITEGIVSASRGRIVNIKNDIATFLADAIKDLDFGEPNVEFADSTTEDAILYINISNNTIMVRIISDDDIEIQVPDDLSNIAKIHDYQKLGGPKQAIKALQRIRYSLRERLIDRL